MIKLADMYFDDIEDGTVLVYIGDETDGFFERGEKYTVYKKNGELMVDGMYVNTDKAPHVLGSCLAEQFVIDENEPVDSRESLEQALKWAEEEGDYSWIFSKAPITGIDLDGLLDEYQDFIEEHKGEDFGSGRW